MHQVYVGTWGQYNHKYMYALDAKNKNEKWKFHCPENLEWKHGAAVAAGLLYAPCGK